MIEECFKGSQRVFQVSFKGVLGKFQGINLISGISETKSSSLEFLNISIESVTK